VLIPAHPVPVAAETIARAGIARGREVRAVEPWEAFACERLVVPWAMATLYEPHPRLASFLASLVTLPPPGPRRRLYIDRRAAPNRVLANENEVIAALARFGVVPVALEGRTLESQAALFADAELIVAPHGAGLANIVFAPRDCRVVELLPNAYANWCFRRLAAACGLAYDCVVGIAEPGEASIHARQWRIAPTHVQAAVAASLAAPG
jgi:capsular polysaccharide biosynthesis protein